MLTKIALILFLASGCAHQCTKESPLSAAINDDVVLLQRLRARGISLDEQYPERYYWTPLMAAIYFGKTNAIGFLIREGVDISRRDSNGNSALMWAITADDTNTGILLVKQAKDQLTKEDWGKVNNYIEASDNAAAWRSILKEVAPRIE